MLIARAFGGTATSALMQTVVLGLEASPLAPAEVGPTEIPWMWVAVGIGVVAVVAVVILGYMWYRRRPLKK